MLGDSFYKLRLVPATVVFGFSFFLFSCVSKTSGVNGSASDPNTNNKSNEVTKNSSSNAKFVYKPQNSNDLIPRGLDFANAPHVIAFGSCANQNAPQPLWDVIAKNSPDLFLFMGDNVDASEPDSKSISAQYKKLNSLKEFRNFREKIPFLVTWDDNDYGQVGGGSDNPDKEEAKKEFLNQWPYVKDSLRMNQNGIYHSKILGGVKKKSPTVQVIMLDTRWFRSSLKTADLNNSTPSVRYIPNDDRNATLLGEEQWHWLERQLLKPANVRIVVSSIQFVADGPSFEKWGNFPREKERFIQLIKKTNVKNLFIVSGDRHQGYIAKMDVKGWGPLFDITASPINGPKDFDEADPKYVGLPVKKENFGLIGIDWNRRRITIELRDLENKVVNKMETSLRN